jgi:hypothetical protein
MSAQTQPRKETLRLSHGQSKPLLLCLEPLGEQVVMQPRETYEVVTIGGTEGHMELIIEDDKVIVYGWNNSDSAVLHAGKRIAGLSIDS